MIDVETIKDIVSDSLAMHGDKLGIHPDSPVLAETELDIASSILEELERTEE